MKLALIRGTVVWPLFDFCIKLARNKKEKKDWSKK